MPNCVSKGTESAKKSYNKIIETTHEALKASKYAALQCPVDALVPLTIAGGAALVAVSSMPFAFFAGAVSEEIKQCKDLVHGIKHR